MEKDIATVVTDRSGPRPFAFARPSAARASRSTSATFAAFAAFASLAPLCAAAPDSSRISAEEVVITGTVVDGKGYPLRDVVLIGGTGSDTTDAEGRFGDGRNVVALHRAEAPVSGRRPVLAGSILRLSGLPSGAATKAELRLASGRRSGATAALHSAGGRAEVDLETLASGLPRKGLFVLRIDAGSAVEHHLLARMGGNSWALSSRAGAVLPGRSFAGTGTRTGAHALAKPSDFTTRTHLPAALTFSKPGYREKTVEVPSTGRLGEIVLELDASSPVVEAPFDLNTMFHPTGWAGDYSDISVAEETVDVREGDPDAKCLKWTYRSPTDTPAMGWAAVLWQYPAKNWGAKPGRRVLAARRITFWARGAAGGERIEFKAGSETWLTPPERGLYKDSFGNFTSATLDTGWKQFEIPLDGLSTEMVISGFVWAANASPDGSPVTFWVDEVRFE